MYNNKWYDCSDEIIQTKLFFWIYAFGNKNLCELFKIRISSQSIITLPWRVLSKLVYRIHQTEGWIFYNEYTLMMQKMYLDALKDNMVLPYEDDFRTFCHGTKTVWDSWAKTWVLKNYPHIIRQLHNKYPDIKLFI